MRATRWVAGMTAALALGPAAAAHAGVVAFPVPSAGAGLGSIAKAPDGTLWITEQSAAKIARVALDGTITEFPVPDKTAGGSSPSDGYGPTDVVADASGQTMDFLTDIGSSVGFATLDGQVRTFHDGADNAQSIAPARAGGVWEVFFLSSRDPELNAGLVGADGSLRGFPAASDLGLSPMAVAPDGRMFWGDDADAIRSYGEDGSPADYPLDPSTRAESVTSLAFDAGGTLHWTQYDTGDGHPQLAHGGRVGTLGPGGVPSTVEVGDTQPRSMLLGPDGALWWAEKNGLARQDPASGAVQHASLGALDPTAIAFGGDGRLWFVDRTANRVGAVDVGAGLFPAAPATPPPGTPGGGATPVTPATPAAPAVGLKAGAGRLAAVRKRGRLSVTGSLAGPGTLTVRATLPAATARKLGLTAARGARTVTLAAGSHRFTKAGLATLSLKLSAKARRALGRARRPLTVTLTATATAPGATASTATKTLKLRR